MKQHPCTVGLFRDMDEIEFEDLVADIKTHGLRQPIVLFEEQVLDGWNRYRACKQLRIDPATTTFKGPGSPLDYAVSVNLKRRHLDLLGRGMVGLELIPRYAAEAAERRGGGLKRGKDAPSPSREGNGTPGEAADRVAGIVGVSGATLERLLAVQRINPELLTDPTLLTINEKYQAAQKIEKEQRRAAVTRGMTSGQRAAQDERDKIKRILGGVTQMIAHVAAALDTGVAVVELGSKEVEPVLKDLRAAAGKLRALHAKKDKAA